MRVTVTAFGISCFPAIYSCSCASAVVFERRGGVMKTSQICILNKRCDLYSYGRTGCITHAPVCYQETGVRRQRKGEKEEKEDFALKLHSRVALLQSIFGTRFPHTPPQMPPCSEIFFFFFHNLSHWYKVCSFQRHNKCADLVLCSPPPYCIHPLHWPFHCSLDTR